MKGQGLVEYALILILVAVVVLVILAIITNGNNPCAIDKTTYECRNYQVEQCLKSEQYSREECIALVGGK